MTAAQLLAVLVGLGGTMARTTHDVAEAIVEASAAHRVAPELLAAVCVVESRVGTDPRPHLLCGVYPANVRALCARGVARCTGERVHDQTHAAAAILATGLRRCRSWAGAAAYHYSGRCWAPSTWRPRGGRREVIAWGERVAHLAQQIGAGR